MQAKQFYNICNHIKKLIKGTEYEHHVYAVGGCIRSITLGDDIKDIDLCVDIPNGGILFSEWMKENGHTEGDVVVYPQYGTAMFRLKDFPTEEIEVVQTRKEQYRDKNSRNPETVFGTLEEDCFRRDFCCNSLYMNISDGLVKDITRMGYCDITNKIIRTTNDPYIVFNDDALRIMRACRFQAQLGFKIEERTLKGMKDNAHRIQTIVRERITDEFCKLLLSPFVSDGLKTMNEVGLFKYITPELIGVKGKIPSINKICDIICKTRPKLELRLAAFFYDYYDSENSNVKNTLENRFKLPRKIIDETKFLIDNRDKFVDWGKDLENVDKVLFRRYQYEFGYQRMDELLNLIEAENFLEGQFKHLRWLDFNQMDYGMYGYKLPITGNDVMEIKHIEPCEKVKLYLDYLLHNVFENPELKREDLIKILKETDF